MRRALLTAALLAVAVPATASAAPFGELPFRPVNGPASCVGATGFPGELSRWTRTGVELSTARADGIVVQSVVPFGVMQDCPVVVSDPDGFAAMAAVTKQGVRIAIREPGGTWAAPTTVAARLAGGVRVAVSARGDVLVAWTEGTNGFRPKARVRVVRRAAGEPFGAPRSLGADRTGPQVAVGLSGDGAGVVAISDEHALQVATAPAGAAFGAPRTLATGGGFGSGLALAVDADGRALLAASVAGRLGVFERDPGAAFARRTEIPVDNAAQDVAVALGTGGAAAVAWQAGEAVSLVRREAVAAFATPIVIRAADTNFGESEAIVTFSVGSNGTPIDGTPPLRVLLGADGRATLTWATVEGAGFVSTAGPVGGPATERAGSPLRDVAGLTPLTLADGARGIAWSDHNQLLSIPPFAGRVHLAVEGAASPPAAPVPELTVGAPRDASLRSAQALVLPIHCSAACDVRATRAFGFFDPGLTLTRAGTAQLRIDPLGRALAPAKPGPIKVKLSWSAPGAREVQRRTFSVRLRRLSPPPFPRLLDVRARRVAGNVVDVRWSTDVPARDAEFAVFGTHTRSLTNLGEEPTFDTVEGNGRRRFHVRLTSAARVRWVRVYVSESVGERHHVKLVRVA